ncbi:MAG TPA: hypothetical protein PKV22_00025 [Paludibacteraceae bacterium]|nr:hypothetical protein [Paludibacteraceae bacterium]
MGFLNRNTSQTIPDFNRQEYIRELEQNLNDEELWLLVKAVKNKTIKNQALSKLKELFL